MPQLSHTIAKRLEELLNDPPECILSASGLFRNSDGATRGRGWRISAVSLIATVVVDPQHPYRIAAAENLTSIYLVGACNALFGQLQELKRDFEAGLLSNLEGQVSAQTFDDLLDHAEAYLQDKRHEPAGVLAGVVFEDTVRKLCGKHAIPQDGVPLDTLLTGLVKAGVITPLERKEGTTAAALRTSATHARWDEYKADQVETVVRLTRRLLREKLAV
jgi:hypothetical protein